MCLLFCAHPKMSDPHDAPNRTCHCSGFESWYEVNGIISGVSTASPPQLASSTKYVCRYSKCGIEVESAAYHHMLSVDVDLHFLTLKRTLS